MSEKELTPEEMEQVAGGRRRRQTTQGLGEAPGITVPPKPTVGDSTQLDDPPQGGLTP